MPRAATPFDSWDAVKLIALLLMAIDHTGAFFYTHDWWLRAIGRGAAPIFLFLGGYAASYRFKWDLLILAIMMTISDILLAGHLRPQNILYNIILCRLLLNWLQRRGKIIEHPYQWYFCCLAWVLSVMVIQYGTFGLLFALCGYMKRRPEQYALELRKRFFMLTFVTYWIFSSFAADFSHFNTVLMAVTLYGVYQLLWRMEIRNIDTHAYPQPLVRLGKWISRYSGYVYALHLIALEWVTGIPF